MSGVATAVVGAAVIGGVVAADSSRKAAHAQEDAINAATKTTKEAGQKAKNEIMSMMIPEIDQYSNSLISLQDDIKAGTVDIMNVLQQSTGRASEILAQGGLDAQRAILGSTARSQGIPRQQFSTDYASGSYTGGQVPNLATQLPVSVGDPRMLPTSTATIGPESQVTKAIGSTGSTLVDRIKQAMGLAGQEDAVKASFDSQAQAIQQANLDKVTQPTSTAIQGIAQSGPTMGIPVGEESKYSIPATSLPGTVDMVRQPDGSYAAPAAMPGATATGGAVPATGYTPGTGFYGATEAIQRGQTQGMQSLERGYGLGVNALSPYTAAGEQATYQEAALSGALGPELQQEAINNFIESPGQAYLRQQQEEALLRNASAIGGLGGGRVRTALQEQAMGIASTQQQQYLENLRSLSTRGQSAASQIAELSKALGVSEADLSRMSAQQIAALAETAGINLSQIGQQTSSNLAAQINNFGSNIAAVKSGALTDIVNLAERRATNTLQAKTGLATNIANITSGAGSNIANLQAAGGEALAQGIANQGNITAGTIQSLGNVAAYGMSNLNTTPTTTPTTTAYTGAPTAYNTTYSPRY